MRLFRLSYIVPRLLLLLLLLAATEVGLGYALRWSLIRGGETASGARVDVGHVKASLLHAQVSISQVEVANPRAAFRNLFEADRVDIDFDSTALLRKKLIAPYGEISGIRFGTERAKSGLLPNSLPTDQGRGESRLAEQASIYARSWLDDVQQRFSQDLRSELRSIELAEQLADRWPQEYGSLRQQARDLKQEVTTLADQVKVARQNPLRHVDFLASLPRTAAELRGRLSTLHSRLAELPQSLAADRQAIATARAHDERVIREKLKVDPIDADSLTNYLLGERLAGPVRETVAWLRWARQLAPASKTPIDDAQRGTDVVFAGVEQRPDVWLKKLRIAGAAEVGGQPVELAGTLTDLTSHPEIVGQPTVLELKSTGGTPIRILAHIDRTSDVPRDRVQIECDALPLPAVDLGRNGPLGLSLSPTTAQVHVSLQVVGQRVAGEVQIVQRNVRLAPRLRNARLREELEAPLAESLGDVEQLATRVTLSGTLDRPRVKLWSNIGSTIAESTRQAVALAAQHRAADALAAARGQVDDAVTDVESQLTAMQREVTDELTAPGQLIAQFLGQQPGGPLDQLGRLPRGSLFK